MTSFIEFRIRLSGAALNPAPAGPKTAGAAGTFDHVISSYRGNKKFKDLAASTRYAKGTPLDWIAGLIGRAYLAELQPYQIENMMDRKGGPEAANRLLKELSELYSFAVKHLGVTLTNPTARVETRKTRRGGIHTWTDEQVEQYQTTHPTGTMARLALELFLGTGASRQDANDMGRHNIKGDTIYYRRGKTGQDTELPLKYMPCLVAEIVQLPYGTNIFITHSEGRPYTKESFGNWFADQCKAAGLPDKCRAHGLRKHGATKLAEAGANEFQIMAFLAHKDTREAIRYVRAASRKKLAEQGMALAYVENVSNLSDWLGKYAPQLYEKAGK